jgi:phosphoribosylanthranilate isomerase
MTLPRVKVSLISDLDEARAATAAGIAALGFASVEDGGEPGLTDERIGLLAAKVPPGVTSFLVTAATDVDSILEKSRRTRVHAIELTNPIELDELRMLRALSPGVRLLQTVRVESSESIAQAKVLAAQVDGLVLDVERALRPRRAQLLRACRRIRDGIDIPVWMRAATVEAGIELIDVVEPFGLDVTDGVRVDGRLDRAKLATFLAQLAEDHGREDTQSAESRRASGA